MATTTPAPALPPSCPDLCPTLVRTTLRVIAGKWAVPILLQLLAAPDPLRYGELRRRVAGITPKELARQLRALEAAGLVDRTVYPTVPPSVEYRPTASGRGVAPVLSALASWGALVHGRAEPLECAR